MKQSFQFSAQAGGGMKDIYEAIEGLKTLKKEHKEQLGMDLDISVQLKGIKVNLESLVRLTEKQ